MRHALSIKANGLLLILWMMLIHTAFPHVHHEYEEHSHHEALEIHTHDRHGERDSENDEKDTFFDFFFQNHTHTNHLPQSISVNQDKSDLVKEDKKTDVEVAVFPEATPLTLQLIESEWLENWDDPLITSHFFTCNSLRGPPVLG